MVNKNNPRRLRLPRRPDNARPSDGSNVGMQDAQLECGSWVRAEDLELVYPPQELLPVDAMHAIYNAAVRARQQI